MKIIITLLGLLCLTHCGLGCIKIFPKVKWDTVRVRFTPFLGLIGPAFKEMPLTKRDAEDHGFRRIGDSECDGGELKGYRYVKDNDPAVTTHYDKNGFFAGFSTSIPADQINEVSLRNYEKTPAFLAEKYNGKNVYTATIYMQHPDKICTVGRTKQQFENHEGMQPYIRNGTNDYIEVPLHEDDIKKNKWFKKMRCFPLMGQHYWYSGITTHMNCDDFWPFGVYYDNEQFVGMAYAVFGNLKSKWYELARWYPSLVLNIFFNPVPDCLKTRFATTGFHTLHVYFNFSPWNWFCNLIKFLVRGS